MIHNEAPVQKSLMHVQALVNGVRVKAMVDNGATHNFMATREVTRLGLKLENQGSQLQSLEDSWHC